MGKTISAVGLMLFFFGIVNCSYGFSDVNENYWGYEAINSLTEKKILSGYLDGTFKPDNNMTRAEFITVLIKTIEPNVDVSSDSGYWAEKSISLAKEKKIIIESEYSNFDPNKEINRREICFMIYRSIVDSEKIDIDKLSDRKSFVDISENDEESRVVALLSHIGVLNGYLDGTVRLDKFSSRAETCCFIDNLMKNRYKVISTLNDNEVIRYKNDIATVNYSKLPYSLKKWNHSKDIGYVTTEIKDIIFFPFNDPPDRYKSVFERISSSDNIYLQYRKKFGEGNYVIAVEFETTNNTSQYEVYTGAEFLKIGFLEDIEIKDVFDISEIERQLNKNADIGQLVRPGESVDTSAFYVVNKLPVVEIRFDRTITSLYDLIKKENSVATSFHSLIINLESR